MQLNCSYFNAKCTIRTRFGSGSMSRGNSKSGVMTSLRKSLRFAIFALYTCNLLSKHIIEGNCLVDLVI